MTKPTDMETRMRDAEKFIAEVRGGRRLFLWLCSAIGGGLAILGVFWDHIFGGPS